MGRRAFRRSEGEPGSPAVEPARTYRPLKRLTWTAAAIRERTEEETGGRWPHAENNPTQASIRHNEHDRASRHMSIRVRVG